MGIITSDELSSDKRVINSRISLLPLPRIILLAEILDESALAIDSARLRGLLSGYRLISCLYLAMYLATLSDMNGFSFDESLTILLKLYFLI